MRKITFFLTLLFATALTGNTAFAQDSWTVKRLMSYDAGDAISADTDLTDGQAIVFRHVSTGKFLTVNPSTKLIEPTADTPSADNAVSTFCVFTVHKVETGYTFESQFDGYYIPAVNYDGKYDLKVGETAVPYTINTTSTDKQFVITSTVLFGTESQYGSFDMSEGTRFVGWHGTGTNCNYQIIPVTLGTGENATVEITNVTYNYYFGDTQRYTKSLYQFVGQSPAAPEIPFITISGYETEENITAGATVKVNCEVDLPFTASESYDNATWYVLNNMSATNRYWEYTTTNNNTKLLSNTTTFPAKNIAPDASLWCFVGNLFDGFKIYSKAGGADLTVTKGSNGFYTLAENATNNLFKIVPSGTNAGTICFTADGTNYLNNQSGGLKDYNIAESGSSFRLLAPTFVISNTAAGYLATTEVPEGYVGTNPAVNAVKDELQAKYDAVVAAPQDMEKGQTLSTLLNNIDETQKVGIDPNKYYRIQNLVRGDGAGNKKMIGLNAAGQRTAALPVKTDVSTLWKFAECEENGVMGYKLYSPNKKAYLGTAGANALVDAYQQGGRYRLLDLGGAQFTLTDGNNSNIVIYGSGEIGNWSSAGKDGDGAWYIIPATDIEVAMHEADGKYWATTYLPFGAKVADGLNVAAYTATVADGANESEKVLNLASVEGIAAETGVILYGTGSTCTLNIDETATTDDKGALSGMLVANTAADNSAAFVLSNGNQGMGFYHLDANAGTDPATYTLAANKAYLASDAIPSSVQALRFSFGDVTGITDIEAGKGNAADVYFDLSGRRVSTPAKGIYVQNGKKVFVK